MPLPPLDTLCKSLEDFPADLGIHLPGGALLLPHLEGIPPSLFQMAQHMLGQANTALAPLSPFFDVVEDRNRHVVGAWAKLGRAHRVR